MATLVLGSAATALSGSIGASPLVSALLSGAAAVGGAYADGLLAGALSPTQRASVTGPRISDLRLQTSTEGAPVQDAFGRVRLAGQVIWATRLRMEVRTSTETTGGKGGGGGRRQTVTTTTYHYFANFAVGLCEAEISGIGRVWADGKALDLSRLTHRVYTGSESQQPDPLITAKEGNAPAYRGTAYVVFENLALEDFGNRIPQLEFEVFRQLIGVEDQVQGMVMIPGAGEWVYGTTETRRNLSEGASQSENINNQVGGTDWSVSLDNLQKACPNVASVMLVVTWFGTDLRCGTCEVRPGVETGSEKTNAPHQWQVHGQDRSGARLISTDDGRPAYGGTPSDQSVAQALRDLKARGLSATFCPFLLMDIPAGSGLPDPKGAAEQPAYPWRGRITCHPAPGQPGSPDKSGAAATQVAGFFGTAGPEDISVSIDPANDLVTTSYSGPAAWGYRRMVLHYAHLCAAVNALQPGTVTTFLIGTELRGLTFVRDSGSSYPAVTELVTLAADCRAILGPSVKLTYAADWSEYRGHDPADGSGDFHFHLDPLWSSQSIDAVGIDAYFKLSDWRSGTNHLDALAGFGAITDLDYLKGNIEGGEDYDWSYLSDADRDAQIRAPITDGPGDPAAGLTLTHSLPAGWVSGSILDLNANVVFSCTVRLPAAPSDGVLFEHGGAGIGTWVGLRDGGTVFRVRAGDGGFSLSASDPKTAVLDLPVSGLPMDGDLHALVWEIRTSPGRVRLWVDGEPAGQAYTSGLGALEGGKWSGGGSGVYLIAGTDGNFPQGEPFDAWPAPGDASNLSVFDGGQTAQSGQDWVFRAKDVRNWWLNLHHDRPGGVENGSPTAWVPQSKPVWFTEYGFPSVDKATNQPNVFVDPKSSESAWPYYINGQRTDLVQRRGIEALLSYWDPAAGNNQVSAVYGGPMLDLQTSYLWTWDARAYPAFPNRSDIWGDAANWQFGHWVQGKFGAVGLGALVVHLCAQVGFSQIDGTLLTDPVTGWLRSGITSPREQLEMLADIYRFDMVESEGVITCVPRGRTPVAALAETDLASLDREKADWTLTRAQETDLPIRASLGFWDAASDYRQTSVDAGRLVTSSARVESATAPIVMEPGEAEGRIEAWLLERWVEREQAAFALPPSKIAFDPGDALLVIAGERTSEMRLTRIVDGGARQCEAVAVEPSIYNLKRGDLPAVPTTSVPSYGDVLLEVLDMPVISDTQGDHQPWLAAYADPWGGVRVQEGSRILGSVTAPATMGRTETDFFNGTAYRFDRANMLTVKLSYGVLSSVTEDELLERAVNVLAVWNGEDAWELIQFASAELVGDTTWQLSGLLRGRRGTAHAMRDPVPAGSRVVLLNEALAQADLPLTDRGIERAWDYGPAPLPSSDTTFKQRSNTLQAVALKPFAPVHVRGSRNTAGDLAVTWIRQARKNAAWADGTDVPLVEDAEAYEIDILSGGSVLWTVSGLTSPNHTYSAADQVADFGSLQSAISLRVVQISATVGRGIPTEAIL